MREFWRNLIFRFDSKPCFCHIRVEVPSHYLDMLDKLQKRVCSTDSPCLAASLESLAHRLNVACLNLFYRHYFERYSPKLAGLVPLLYSHGRIILIGCILLSPFFAVLQDVCIDRFFPLIARLWNSSRAECFPLTYDLNNFKSRVIGTCHLWILSNQLSYILFIFVFFFFL